MANDFFPAALALSILAVVFLFAFLADMRNIRRRSEIVRANLQSPAESPSSSFAGREIN